MLISGQSSAELECPEKSKKKAKYEDILETLGHSFKCNYGYYTKCYRILQLFQFLEVPSHQHQQ